MLPSALNRFRRAAAVVRAHRSPWPRRAAFSSLVFAAGFSALWQTGSYLLSAAATSAVVLGGVGLMQVRAMRSAQERWKVATEVVIAVLSSLKNEHARSDAQRRPTWINLALLYRVQQHLDGGVASSSSLAPPSCSSVAPAALREAQRYMMFATSAYGHAAMVAFGPRACKRAPSTSALLQGAAAVDVEALARHTGIGESDVVLLREPDEVAACPAFFIALDRASAAIVLSVRGTASIFDAVVHDLVCVAEPFADGVAHAGMARAARALRTAAMPTLARLAHEHRGFRVVLTGHSMGGGVAALLAVLIEHERREVAQARRLSAALGESGGGHVGEGHTVAPGAAPSAAAFAAASTASEACGGAAGGGVVVGCGAVSDGSGGGSGDGSGGVVVGAFGGLLRVLPALPLDTSVACITFAAPPVYAPAAAAAAAAHCESGDRPEAAARVDALPPDIPRALADSITQFVHNSDVVPSLSLANVRSLLAALRAIDEVGIASTRTKLAVLSGRSPPPVDLLEAVRAVRSGGGAAGLGVGPAGLLSAPPALRSPGREVVMLSHLGGGSYEATAWGSAAFAERGLRLAPSMASDHVFGYYEGALAACSLSCHPFGGEDERMTSAGGAEKAV